MTILSRDQPRILVAIDVGTNAARLELARLQPDGTLETLHYQRDAIRPGEGVFDGGWMPDHVVQRLCETLGRYAARCRQNDAEVRAVATSALRDAHNRNEVVAEIRQETGINLEVISGAEEARLICMGVLQGRAEDERSIVIDIGGGSTEVASGLGRRPVRMWSLPVGAVRLTQMFGSDGKVSRKLVRLMRAYVRQSIAETLPAGHEGLPPEAYGSSGTIKALVAFASPAATGSVTTSELRDATEDLLLMPPRDRLEHFDQRRAEVIVAGALILEGIVEAMQLERITSVDHGLRNGIFVDLQERLHGKAPRTTLHDEAIAVGRRFQFDEEHGRHVAALACRMFDELASVHGLPDSLRPLLETAAILHDIGKAVSIQRHHKHTFYLIQNTDIAGLVARERELVARVARFHRRSVPDKKHPDLFGLGSKDVRHVQCMVAMLRLADALDRSHHQLVEDLSILVEDDTVRIRPRTKDDVELELWDAKREIKFFEKTFRVSLALEKGETDSEA